MADSFIELRFGQMDDVQREIIPVYSIKSVYVDLTTSTDIVFVWEMGEKTFKRVEYYENEWQCNRRWNELRKIFGVDHQTTYGKGNPIPMEASDWTDLPTDERANIYRGMTKFCDPPEDEDAEG